MLVTEPIPTTSEADPRTAMYLADATNGADDARLFVATIRGLVLLARINREMANDTEHVKFMQAYDVVIAEAVEQAESALASAAAALVDLRGVPSE